MNENRVLDSIADGVTIRQGYAISMEMFEGPLDLLLHLVRRHELDVLDIPIAFITEKYVEYLEFARALDIEVAGEYLVMAATLAFLKSRELLPPDPNAEELEEAVEEGVDPREELIRRLIEYERFRNAGDELNSRPLQGRDVFERGGNIEVEPLDPGLAPITLFKLAEAYNRVIDRARINAEHEVQLEPISVQQRMRQLSLMLRDARSLDFENMFLEREWSSEDELRGMLVVTLMSVLEMVKLGLLTIHQPQGSTSLMLERQVDAERMDGAIESYEEDEELGAEGSLPEIVSHGASVADGPEQESNGDGAAAAPSSAESAAEGESPEAPAAEPATAPADDEERE
jgi:segregation and condensation protein A